MQNIQVIERIRNTDSVCFDVDSTVIVNEGIDILAQYCGVGDEVRAFTVLAMEGRMKFEDALGQRLQIIRPSLAQLHECVRSHPPQLTPGIEELVSVLQSSKRVPVFLVSGGFRQMIEPIALRLRIPADHIIANSIRFDASTGEYAGYDESAPTSRSGGKLLALQQIQQRFGVRRTLMVGDGVTDLETKPAVCAFVGFGGNRVRPTVQQQADMYITEFAELIRIFNKC